MLATQSILCIIRVTEIMMIIPHRNHSFSFTDHSRSLYLAILWNRKHISDYMHFGLQSEVCGIVNQLWWFGNAAKNMVPYRTHYVLNYAANRAMSYSSRARTVIKKIESVVKTKNENLNLPLISIT